ncbi:MAG TPA: AsmA family protein [Terriglobales bacterium]|nr:AsmA family protein [Terriglobales bacterium]
MKWIFSKRGLAIGGVIVLLALFLIRPGANQLRNRIVLSISRGVGLPVEVSYVRIRVLPRPGFDLENFVVHDDPAFGAEPMLRASDVSASLRLRSLLRGRLEIARLSLTEPSLNLVRNSDGHWNLERLLERSAQIQVAPTSKSPSETRPGFPYVEASRGRINFKFGAEKKPYTLTDADFALWQDSENAWGVRLQAEPVRTDFNLTDTGRVRVNGLWQRAPSLRETPVQFTLVWDRAQLGQLSQLLGGNDKGWRGSLSLQATLSGTPADLSIRTDLAVGDFHRYDIVGNGSMRLAAQCTGQYSSRDKMLAEIMCNAPGSGEAITLEGTMGNPFALDDYDVTLTMQGMPVQRLVNFAHHATHALPYDLTTTGQVDAKLRLRRSAGEAKTADWSGGGEISDAHFASPQSEADFELHSVPFSFGSPATSRSKVGPLPRSSGHIFSAPAGPYVLIGPFRLGMGRPAPVLVSGWMAHSGYSFRLQGEGQVSRLLQAARTVGIPALSAKADGVAKIDLQFAGDWSGQNPVRATGEAQLRSIRAQLREWNEPLEIASADMDLLPDKTDVKNLAASVAGAAWHGSLSIPRPCGMTSVCAIHFDLHADEIALGRVNQLLNPAASKQPWYHFLSASDSTPPYLLIANASGKLSANRVTIHNLTATQFSAKVELESGHLRLSEMRAEVLGGRHTGEWQADFTSKPPKYSGNGSLERVSLRQLATAMHDGWVTGSANVSYRASASGLDAADLYSSAAGTLQVEAWEAALPHMTLSDGDSALQVRHLAAAMTMQDEKFAIRNGQLDSPDGTYQLSGTASFGRVLNLKLTREGMPGFAITGTLAEPHVSQVSSAETQAALKR